MKLDLNPQRMALIIQLSKTKQGKMKLAQQLVNPIKYIVDRYRNEVNVEFSFAALGDDGKSQLRQTIHSSPFMIIEGFDTEDVGKELLMKMKDLIKARNNQEFVVKNIDVVSIDDNVTMNSACYQASIVGWFKNE